MSDETSDIMHLSPGSRGATSPRSPDASAQRSWSCRVWLLMLAMFCVRVVYIAVVPLELCPDEAYYWDWSRQLDWGYYSKPPMIAWMIALATSIGGHNEFAIRFPAAILGTLGLWPVFALGRDMFHPRVGFWAVVAIAVTPGMAAMNLLMTIDAPFLCAWAFAVWCAWRLFGECSPHTPCAENRHTECAGCIEWRWLFAAILCTGLGLLSKQTMLGLFPLVLLWLASDAPGRGHLRRPAVWIWMAGSLLCLAPVVWWNWQHGWITVQHTREHFQSKSISLMQHVGQCVEFWAGQFGIVSPILGGLMVALGIKASVSWSRSDRRIRFLVCLSAVPLVGVAGLSLTQQVQPNWPASFHLTAFVLLAAWGCGAWNAYHWLDARRHWFSIGTVLALLMTLGVYAVPFAVPGSSLAGGNLDPTVRLRGWKSLGALVGDKLQGSSLQHETLMIAATSRPPVSALAFYVPGQPTVYRWNSAGVVNSQHDIWGGPRGSIGAEALILTHRLEPVPIELAAAFDEIDSQGQVEISLGGSRREVYSVWRGVGYRGWPRNPIQVSSHPQTAASLLRIPQ